MINVKVIDVRAIKLRMGQGPSTFWDFGKVFEDVPFALITTTVTFANGDNADLVTVKPIMEITSDISARAKTMVMFNDEHIGFMNELNGQLEIFGGNDGIEVIVCCYIETGIVELH